MNDQCVGFVSRLELFLRDVVGVRVASYAKAAFPHVASTHREYAITWVILYNEIIQSEVRQNALEVAGHAVFVPDECARPNPMTLPAFVEDCPVL
ncbi:hypothetical protein A4G29_11400 [Mycobacterium kansasii]|nr:hypothetical protein A4G29_11400 [Mycobacterium kansasii]